MSGTDRLIGVVSKGTKIKRTPRVMQLEGMFDVAPAERADLSWSVDLPLGDKDWHIGLIVGPSGCGKTTIARELFQQAYTTGFDWHPELAVVDGFPPGMSIKDVTQLLASVGFSSPPAWLRPYAVLSNGEQFRATLARALAAKPDLCVFDEFTSVVDRTVGKIGSSCVAKTVRKRGGKFIAVTCHDDVLDWLDPDWVYTPADNVFAWRSLQGRPKIQLEIARVHHSAWKLFVHHHYLSADLSKAAVCFVGFVDGKPAGFQATLPFMGRLSGGAKARRSHRTVVLPDYQGVGIGNTMTTTVASMWSAYNLRVFRQSGHPAYNAGAMRDPAWRLTRRASLRPRDAGGKIKHATSRMTTSFEYIGPKMDYQLATRLLEQQATPSQKKGPLRGQ